MNWKEITDKVKQWRIHNGVKTLKKYRSEYLKRAEELIQAREFNGKIYLAYGSEPIVAEDELKEPIAKALQKARENWADFKLRNYNR